MDNRIGRREFLKKSAKIGFSAAAGFGFVACTAGEKAVSSTEETVDIAVAHGSDYYASTLKAVESLGGMEIFVPKGARVAILPNSQSKNPGTFTKPDVIRAVVEMCKKAGAGEVNCLTWFCIKKAERNRKLIDLMSSIRWAWAVETASQTDRGIKAGTGLYPGCRITTADDADYGITVCGIRVVIKDQQTLIISIVSGISDGIDHHVKVGIIISKICISRENIVRWILR